jgi:hypothetical protein
MKLAVAIATMLVVPITATGTEESPRCPQTGIRAPGWSAEERERVCAASADAVSFLQAAGLVYRDGLTIAPLPAVDREERSEHVIGCYDPARNEIRILRYDASIVASHRYPPAFGMPMTPALWQGFISHETAHAVAERHFAAGVRRPTASEYIAGVVQLATLPPDPRDAILARYGNAAFSGTGDITMLLYDIDPAVFAVMAYRHYTALGERGPAFIARLLNEGLDE